MAPGAIGKVAVIGSGVMGSGIAAQIANAGVPVLLLDIVGEETSGRSAIARAAIERMGRTEPAPLMAPGNAALITPGNLEDDLAEVASCDWVIEVVLERLDVKQALYRKLDAVRRPGTPVSSNTSTIPLAALVAGLPEAFARDFLITHFFNPPRYMRLLELVTGPATDPDVAARIARFCDVRLGKSIVPCPDSPGFIANRLGVYWLQRGMLDAAEEGLTVEEADAVMGKPFGMPKTGVFGLVDLIGLDLMPHMNASLVGLLPAGDAFHEAARDLPLLPRLIADGFTGRKGKGGFYRMSKVGGTRVKEAVDLATGQPSAAGAFDGLALKGAEKDLRALMASDSKLGRYAWRVMGRTLAYAASLVPEAADDITGIDEAMRLGYNWQRGPFELIDALGAAWLVGRLRDDGVAVPELLQAVGDKTFYRVEGGRRQVFGRDGAYHDRHRPDGVLLLEDVKLVSRPLLKNASAALWDIGDGVVCFEFTSKMNALDLAIMDLLLETIALVEAESRKGLVIYGDGANFSVGANLAGMLSAAKAGAWPEIEALIRAGQAAFARLKAAPFPVVAAAGGLALGGGCEVLLHSDAIQAHAELSAGLVECGVGLVPGWGGCKEMLLRWSDDPGVPRGAAVVAVFALVRKAIPARSAAEAREMKILRAGDGITMNRYRLLADAKAKVLDLAATYAAPEPGRLALPGAPGRLAMERSVAEAHARGEATDHDLTVAAALAGVLSGGSSDPGDTLTEGDVLALEREAFMRLVRTPETLARIEHTLATGKPLRN